MQIDTLELVDFRNYVRRTIELGPEVNAIWGNNACGKTNILEAVYMLATGESFRAKRTEEMVRFGQEWGKVRAVVDREIELSVMVSAGVINGKSTVKKRFFVEGVPKRKGDFVGLLKAVVFRPEDLDLMSGSPSIRRDFMDKVLSQQNSEYRRGLLIYEQALRRRNKILMQIREGEANRYALAYYDQLLIKHGGVLQDERQKFVEYVNMLWAKSEMFVNMRVELDMSIISEDRLKQYEVQEVQVGHTLVGPHKDDWVIWEKGVNDRNLSLYGSRGEQRMAILALKVGELYYLEKDTDSKALLLLDDVFSELDETHKIEVSRIMKGRQVILTTAIRDEIESFENVRVLELESGSENI